MKWSFPSKREIASDLPAFCFLALFVFFYLPLDLYLKNHDFLDSSAIQVLILSLATSFGLCAVSALLLVFLTRRLRVLTASLATCLGISCFVHNLLPLGADQPLDGSRLIFQLDGPFYYVSIYTSVSAFVCSLLFYAGRKTYFNNVLATMSLLFLITPVVRLILTEHPKTRQCTSSARMGQRSPGSKRDLGPLLAWPV